MNQLQQPLLIIEDSDEDFTALSRAIKKTQVNLPIYRCEDGDEALDFLYHEGEYQETASSPRPSLIILDLNLPGTDGREVLAEVKQDRELKTIPVVIFSTSSNPKDITACYGQGVSGYMVKPMNSKHFTQLVQTFLDYWFKVVEIPIPPDSLNN